MTMQFRVQAEAESQCLARLIDCFAQRGLIPSAVATSHVGDTLRVVIEHPTIDDMAAGILCERMARMTSVASATIRRLAPA